MRHAECIMHDVLGHDNLKEIASLIKMGQTQSTNETQPPITSNEEHTGGIN